MIPVRAIAVLALAASLVFAATPVASFGAPRSVDLDGTARGVAVAGNGALVVVGTADGVYGFSPAGDQVFHVLAGMDITAVAVNRFADVVVAGDSNGLVHLLRGNGAEFATGITVGGITAASTSDDGSVVAVGTNQNYLSSFNPALALPPPLAQPPVNPLSLLLPQWSYGLSSPVTFVSVTADGLWVNAANAGVGPGGRAWLFGNDARLVPGGIVSLPFFGDLPPCGFISALVKCWIFQQFTPGASVNALSNARNSYSMIISYSSGWTIATSAASYFANPWNFKANGAVAAAHMSADGSRVLVGDTFGNVYGVANVNAGGGEIPAQWSASIGSRVAKAALSANGGVEAVADAGGAITLFDATGAVTGTASAGGALTGLALTPDGLHMIGTTGDTALFWS